MPAVAGIVAIIVWVLYLTQCSDTAQRAKERSRKESETHFTPRVRGGVPITDFTSPAQQYQNRKDALMEEANNKMEGLIKECRDGSQTACDVVEQITR